MVDYRLYFFDEASGHIRKAELVQAADDQAAIQSVEENHAGAGKLELWQHARLVKAWPVLKLTDPLRHAVEASCRAIDDSIALMAEVDRRVGAASRHPRDDCEPSEVQFSDFEQATPLRRP